MTQILWKSNELEEKLYNGKNILKLLVHILCNQ